MRLALLPLAMARFARLTLRRRPAIAHFFLGEPYIAGAPIAGLFRVPVCVMSRRSLNRYLANMPGAARIEARLHRRMTAILANSRAIITELAAEGSRPDQLGLIYNGIDTQRLRPVRKREEIRAELAIPPGAVVAIIVANLNAYKGHADLIAGLGAVRDRMLRDWVLLCAGRDDGARGEIREAIGRLGLASNVRLLGARSDIADLLAAADIGVLCSHQEGFSNALIEKMAAGLPVVVTDVGGNPEATLDGVTGLVVPPRSPEALGAAIARLATDPALRRQLGAAGRARVETLFTFDAMVSRYDALYRGLLAGRRPSELPEIAVAAAPGQGLPSQKPIRNHH